MTRTMASCAAVWGRTSRPLALCRAFWGPTRHPVASCGAVWGPTARQIATCRAAWGGMTRTLASCAARWGASGRPLALCAAVWGAADALIDDALSLEIAGVEYDPVRVSVTWTRTQSLIEAEVELATAAEWDAPARHAAARLLLWGYDFALLVESWTRNETFESTSWTLRLASPAARLESPWAEAVEGELSGRASEIAARLAGEVPVRWQTVDWEILPGRWTATGQAPLELLQALATACGAALVSAPDGALDVLPLYAVSPQDWASASPAVILDAAGDVISLAASPEDKAGYDRITVSDAAAAEGGTRLEEDAEARGRLPAGQTEVLVYQTPWRDNVALTHRGDPARASITDLGVEEWAITDEEIIIVDGAGNTALPVYGVLSVTYNARNLGAVTSTEAGAVETAVKGESILLLTYRTKARRYRVSEADLRDLLIVAED